MALDALIVTIFMIIFEIWEAKKSKTFFEDTPDHDPTNNRNVKLLPVNADKYASSSDTFHSGALPNKGNMNESSSGF